MHERPDTQIAWLVDAVIADPEILSEYASDADRILSRNIPMELTSQILERHRDKLICIAAYARGVSVEAVNQFRAELAKGRVYIRPPGRVFQ